MKDEDLSNLLQRYQKMIASGRQAYFDADEYDELVEYYEKLEDIETAKKILYLGLEIHPMNEGLMLRHARFLIYDGEYQTGLDYLNNHFREYDFEISLLKIESLLHLGLYSDAYQLTQMVIEDKDIETSIILSELGFIYVEADYFDEAILYFEKSIEYEAENLEVLYDLVYAYESVENFTLAISTCERILDIDPYAFDGWFALGRLLSLDQKYEKAIDAFDFALTLDDSNVDILKLKAHCLILSGRNDEAIDVLKQCIDLVPDDEASYLALIDCYMDLKQSESMLSTISLYESKFGETEDLITKKIYAHYLKGNISDYEHLIKKIEGFDSNSTNLNLVLGDLFFKMEQYETAIQYYIKSDEDKDANIESDVLEKLITSYIKVDDIGNAIKYQKRLSLIDDSEISKTRLALLYLEIGDKENFLSLVHSFEDNHLFHFFSIFFQQSDQSEINKAYILDRMEEIFESRLLYKNLKY